jgi:trehalose 6-phosphate phosphatase
VAPLLVDPAATAVLTDFDGTLSAIVADPGSARLLPGAAEVLAVLARRFGLVAVVSGRPVAYLADRLAGVDGLVLAGLYGLERSGPDGTSVAPGAERWREPVAGVVAGLAAAAPPGVLVEGKGLTVTVHWRNNPEAAPWVADAAAEVASRTGLVAHPGRLSVELRPPVTVDKGTVVEELCDGRAAACFLGDDTGDLPAFAALRRLAATRGLAGVAVAAVSAECPDEVPAAADVVVAGPAGALALLGRLAGDGDGAGDGTD